MEENKYEIHYDEDADFLEVFFGEPSSAIAEEIEPDIFIRRDEKTGEIKSLEIFSFKKRGAGILKKILQKVNLNIPLSIGFE